MDAVAMNTVATNSAATDTVSALLADGAAEAERGGPSLAPLAALLRQAGVRLRQPMRVAVAGQIKRGKSTLVNALLGERVAATGQLELTLTVNELRHGDEPSVTIHYKNATAPQRVSVARFREFTVHPGGGAGSAERMARLAQIRKVEYALPNALLRAFRLIDTPGLGSVHGVDSQNTAAFLGISDLADTAEQSRLTGLLSASGRTASDVHRASAEEIDRADAVLYLFSRALHERDRTAVDEFSGPAEGSMTPLKAFGVLSRCDQYWPPAQGLPGDPDPMTYDPMAVAEALAARCLDRREIRRLFFTVLPTAGLVGLGAAGLTAEQFCWLADLARTEPRRVLVRHLRDVGMFAGAAQPTGVTLPAEQRRALMEELGPWGVHLACGYLRDGLGEQEVRERLLADSGVTRLRELIVGHFGNRASLIKLDHGLREATAEIGRRRLAAHESGACAPEQLGAVADRLQALRGRVHGFAELAALSRYYNGELDLTDPEIGRLLQVTGERGTSCAARVGLPERASAREIEQSARRLVQTWAARALDPTLDRRTAPVVRTMRQSCERIEERARRARLLLETTDESALELDWPGSGEEAPR